jgi:hypothetical protein
MVMNNQNLFPKRDDIWRAAIVSTIAHAIWVVQHPLLAYEQSWTGDVYTIQDSQGTRGSIAFRGNYTLGAFFDSESPFNPFSESNLFGDDYDSDHFFYGIPSELEFLKDEVLLFLLDEYKGKTVPVITTSFWSISEMINAATSWSDVVRNGMHILVDRIGDLENVLENLRSNYEFQDDQVNLVRTLFQKKIFTPKRSVYLQKHEWEIMISKGHDGMEESKRLLYSIGIIAPMI